MSFTNQEIIRALDFYNGKSVTSTRTDRAYLGYHLGNTPPDLVNGTGANEPVGGNYIRLETYRDFLSSQAVAGDPSTSSNNEQFNIPARSEDNEDLVTWVLEFATADLSDTNFVRAYWVVQSADLNAFDVLQLPAGSLIQEFGKENDEFNGE